MRITENASVNTVRDNLNRSRTRMTDLQKQSANMKRLNTPSDDPVGNVKLMSIRNETLDGSQFEKNANLAKTYLNYTDSSLEELTDVLIRAKELAIGQSNGAANGPESRLMVAEELRSMMGQVLNIANRKLSDRYIFAGYRTNMQPFDDGGRYFGDDGDILVEVQKDTFVGMNLPGKELFLGKENQQPLAQPLIDGKVLKAELDPEAASAGGAASSPGEDIFRTLEGLRTGLMTNDIDLIRSTLDPLDTIRDRVITARAQVGSRIQGIEANLATMSRQNVFNAELKSTIEDADMIQTVSDMAKEETVLRASLTAAGKIIQPSLLEFLR